MSQATRWDYQLNQVEMSIADLMNEASLTPDPVASSATIADRDQIDQSLARIAVDSDKVIQAARKASAAGEHPDTDAEPEAPPPGARPPGAEVIAIPATAAVPAAVIKIVADH
ncbi:MAG: hypothetical protein WCO71_03280 [Pseudomonadota bacterium]